MYTKVGFTDEGELPSNHPLSLLDLQFEVHGSVSKYYPATYHSPEEGGEVELTKAKPVCQIRKWSNEKEEWENKSFSCVEELEALGEAFLELTDTDSKLRDRVYEAMYGASKEEMYYGGYDD